MMIKRLLFCRVTHVWFSIEQSLFTMIWDAWENSFLESVYAY